jgi:insertion element IS1 protein InsB
MIMQALHCPNCQGTNIIRHGKTRQGKQRYCCQEALCNGGTFLLDYTYPGHSVGVKQQIVDMAMNASGIRDMARVLHISPTTVIKELKKKESELRPVNHSVLAVLHPEQVDVEVWRADELEMRRGLSSELDEMWSYVARKTHPR